MSRPYLNGCGDADRGWNYTWTMPYAAACSCSWEKLRQAGSPYGSNRFRRPCHSSHKRYRFQARYDISGSSFRVNLGTGFTPLLYDEAGKIKVLDSRFEMFYKENEEATYHPQIRRADYGRRFYFCSSCGTGYYDADKCPVCGTDEEER